MNIMSIKYFKVEQTWLVYYLKHGRLEGIDDFYQKYTCLSFCFFQFNNSVLAQVFAKVEPV